MRFFLLEEQGGGCDYTIGCGLRISEIQATSLEEAKAQVVEEIGDNWRAQHEHGIEKAALFLVEDKIDLRAFLSDEKAKREDEKAKKKARKAEAAERAQYETLKKKFG